ncbi:MAG: GTP pyrophosphokinase family protein [Firmicutes bacterium]|nr:GTP pyrophosphokinase family protein [Bacillota bacterium]
MILEKHDDLKLDLESMPENLKPLALVTQQFMETRNIYKAAIKEISTKLEILDDEFSVKHDYNPIHHIESRVKSIQSIFAKMEKKGLDMTIAGVNALTDIAGIRVICNYKDDVYTIAKLLTAQDDIELIREKDYITDPKPSGYRSLHIVVLVPVFLSEGCKRVPVEIQIRTIAMDTWASLEHELKYKRKQKLSEKDELQLLRCAEAMAEVDRRMQEIHKELK